MEKDKNDGKIIDFAGEYVVMTKTPRSFTGRTGKTFTSYKFTMQNATGTTFEAEGIGHVLEQLAIGDRFAGSLMLRAYSFVTREGVARNGLEVRIVEAKPVTARAPATVF